ncbi:hypothetical protein ACXX81_21170 [Pseudomonas sp. GNP013]
MSQVPTFINPQMQTYSYLKSKLQLGKNSRAKFDVLNAHIINRVVLPGEIIIVGDNSTPSCTADEAFYMKIASNTHIALMENGAQSDGFLVENHQLLTHTLGYASLGIGTVGDAWSKHLAGIKGTLEEIDSIHKTHLASGTPSSRDVFYGKRKVLFEKLDGQLKTFAAYGSGLRNQGPIKKTLGISTKSFLDKGVIRGYANTISGVAKASELIKKGTYLGVGLDIGAAGLSIHKACSSGRELECTKAKYVETSKAGGSILVGTIGGAFGAALAGSACLVVLGLATGPGAFACGLVGGALGGVAGGAAGEGIGEGVGNILYKGFE